MTTLNASEARRLLYRLLDDVCESHEPVTITGKRNSAVLIGEDDWRAIRETLYLSAVPDMVTSVKEAMATSPEDMDEAPGW